MLDIIFIDSLFIKNLEINEIEMVTIDLPADEKTPLFDFQSRFGEEKPSREVGLYIYCDL